MNDVPMCHLTQLVKKQDYKDDVSIDHVVRAIDETHEITINFM
ncbi:unnamed protein product [Rotaria sp. Silwood1]|nr:unnamed protein product [Rotaria sp. Silwood1]CAF1687916.1 unnamed protein product [Rotaria sp. Silwood1]